MTQHGVKQAALAALVLTLAGLLAPAQASAGEAPKRIAVVNVTRVFNAYRKVEDVQKNLKAQFDPRRQELEQQRKELREFADIVQMEGQQLKSQNDAPSPQLFAKMQKLQEMEYTLKVKMKKLAEDIEKFRMEQMKEVLKDIRLAIKTVGENEKYDLIMRAPEYDEKLTAADDEGNADEAGSAMELVRRFRENPVLYFKQSVDVTERVIKHLNDAAPAGATAEQ